MTRKCASCGSEIERRSLRGTLRRHRSLMLTIEADIEADICTGCGAQYLGPEAARAIQHHLAPVFEEEMRLRAKELIEKLEQKTRLWNVAWLLGLPSLYLEKVKNGDVQNVSPGLVAALFLLEQNTEALKSLEEFWGVGSLDDLYAEMQEEWRKEEADHG